MFYVGHFSFMKDSTCPDGLIDDNSWHGYFTTVAKAENVEDALEKFRALICRLYSEEDVFNGVNEIFLDVCVECKTIPDQGFLAHFVQWTGLARGSISTAIRGASDEQVIAYSLGSKDVDDDRDGYDEGPFLLLER